MSEVEPGADEGLPLKGSVFSTIGEQAKNGDIYQDIYVDLPNAAEESAGTDEEDLTDRTSVITVRDQNFWIPRQAGSVLVDYGKDGFDKPPLEAGANTEEPPLEEEVEVATETETVTENEPEVEGKVEVKKKKPKTGVKTKNDRETSEEWENAWRDIVKKDLPVGLAAWGTLRKNFMVATKKFALLATKEVRKRAARNIRGHLCMDTRGVHLLSG